MSNIEGWKMVRLADGEEVPPGSVVIDANGLHCSVRGVTGAPSHSGDGWVRAMVTGDAQDRLRPPDILGLAIVPEGMSPQEYRHERGIPQPAGPERKIVKAELPGGLEGLMAIRDAAVESISQAIAKAYAMGYTEAMEGIPSALPTIARTTWESGD